MEVLDKENAAPRRSLHPIELFAKAYGIEVEA
jgi:hypothetical protein